MLKIRRSCYPLIFNMGISIPGKDDLYIETGPDAFNNLISSNTNGCHSFITVIGIASVFNTSRFGWHLTDKIIIKLCIYVIRSTRSPEGSPRPPGWPQVHQIPRGESAAAGLTAGQPRPRTPRGRSGGPYHVTTQFYFYPVMSNIQNSINIHTWILRRLTCPTQDFGNP